MLSDRFQRVLPFVAGGVGLALSLLLALVLRQSAQGHIQVELQQVHKAVSKVLRTEIKQQVLEIRRMADRWAARGGTPYNEWLLDARNYVSDRPGIQAIEWIDTEFYVRWIEPLAGNEAVLNMKSAFNEKRQRALEASRDQKTAVFTPCINLIQGGKGFLLYVPIHGDEQFYGFILAVYKIKDMVDAILESYAQDYHITIFESGELIYERERNAALIAEMHQDSDLNLLQVPWHVRIYPTVNTINVLRSFVPWLTMIVGCVISVLTMSLVSRVLAVRRNNRELIKLRDELEQSNSDLEAFASVASHDLKAPLRHIQSYVEFLEEDCGEQLSTDGHEYIQGMRKVCKRMADLIASLLAYAQVGGSKLELSRVSLNDIINETISDFQEDFKQLGVTFTADPLPDIRADGVLMQQVVQNIIGNAVKYRDPERTLSISINKQERVDSVQILFSDTGSGFEQEYAQRIFEPFRRLVGKSGPEGSGIGLATVARILRLHGMHIRAESSPGKGSVFIITIPKHALS